MGSFLNKSRYLVWKKNLCSTEVWVLKMVSKRNTRRQQTNILSSHLTCRMQVSKEFDSVPTGTTTLKLLWSVSVLPGRGFWVVVGPNNFRLDPGSWLPGRKETLAGGLFFDTLKMIPLVAAASSSRIKLCCRLRASRALLVDAALAVTGQPTTTLAETTLQMRPFCCIPLYRVAQGGQQPGQVFCPTRLKMHP